MHCINMEGKGKLTISKRFFAKTKKEIRMLTKKNTVYRNCIEQ